MWQHKQHHRHDNFSNRHSSNNNNSNTAASLQSNALISKTVLFGAAVCRFSPIFTSFVVQSPPSCYGFEIMTTSTSSSSKIMRIMFNGGDNMFGRAVQLTFPYQSSGEENIKDSCTASHYLDLALNHPSSLSQDCPSLDEIRKLNRQGMYLWKDYERLQINPPPDLRILNFESHPTKTINNADVPMWKGIRYHTHVDNLDLIIRPYAETTHAFTSDTTNKASPVVLSLANNHVMDYGRHAFEQETLPALRKLHSDLPSVQAIGCGRNWREASKPAAIRVGDDQEVEVFAVSTGCSGTPTSWWASSDSSGIAGLPSLTSEEAVTEAVQIIKRAIQLHSSPRKKRPIRIVSIHMGPNWALKGETSEDIAFRRQFCHKMIDDCDVDIIYGHSSHHPRGIEVYNGKLILYGTGDLINDYEGFENVGEESYITMGGIFVVDIDSLTGNFEKLQMIPMYMNHLQLQRYTESSRVWKPRQHRMELANHLGRDMADFINRLSVIDSGENETSALTLNYVEEENSSVPGGPILASDELNE